MDNRFVQADAAASPPSAPSPGDTGHVTNGNPGSGTAATILGDYWFYQLGEELRAILTAASITPSHTDLDQLLEALRKLRGFNNVQVVTATDAGWTAPLAMPATYFVELWGGGGGGAGGAGASGAAGGYAAKFVTLTASEAVALTVGAGGAAATHPSAAGNGGTTQFGAHFSATGGTGGATGSGSGGAGSSGDINLTGGAGTDLSQAGNGAPGGHAPRGGLGGALDGSAGLTPGGGGGAAYQYDGSTNPSGAGARGEIWIWY